MDWNAVTAIATIVYVIGTFLLWWSTQKALHATRDAFKLNLLLALYRMEREEGSPARIPERWHVDFDTLKRAFATEYEYLLTERKKGI